MNAKFEVRDQNRLSLEKCFGLVFSGVRFRLFRSAVTVVVIALAVAFLVTMLADGFIGQEVARAVEDRSMPRKTFLFWVDRLSVDMTEPEVVRTLVVSSPGDDRQQELKTWGRLDDATMATLTEVAKQEQVYMDWFAGLPEGVKRPLVGRAAGKEILTLLVNETAFEKFAQAMPKTGKQMPTSIEEFKSFLKKWDESKAGRVAIMAGHAQAVAEVGKLMNGKSVTAALCDAEESFRTRIEALGFRLDRKGLDLVKAEAMLNEDVRKVGDLLKVNEFKNRFAAMYNVNARDVTLEDFFMQAASPKDAKAFLDAAAKVASEKKLAPLGISPERMVEVSKYRQEQAKLAVLDTKVVTVLSGKGVLGFSGRTLWLVAVSLLVCVVGIANAMLMSVTERFKEIATMKCLGATDGFIMINFILESAMQGLAGGIVGAVMGMLLGMLRSATNYGFIAIENIPLLVMTEMAVAAIVVGILISILAAVYPAWVAARLAPLEAMRVE